MILLTVAAAVLLVAAGAVVCGIARAVPVTDEPRLPTPAWAAIGKVRDSPAFWAGAALLLALAYSVGHVVDFSLGIPVTGSEYSILRYPLATFAQVLIPVALVLPLAYQGSPARKIVAAAAFGFSMVTSQPDVQVGRWAIPLGTVLLGVLVYAIVKKEDQPAEQANGAVADTVPGRQDRGSAGPHPGRLFHLHNGRPPASRRAGSGPGHGVRRCQLPQPVDWMADYRSFSTVC